MKTVATFREAYQAYLAKDKIEAEGISSILVDEYQRSLVYFSRSLARIFLFS